MFDLVGWSWIYEPLDADGYIPDFLIEGPRPFFVEVGDCITDQDYEAKSAKADRNAGVLGHDVLVVGVSALPFIKLEGSGDLAAGFLGERHPGHRAPDCVEVELGLECDHQPGFVWAAGVWAQGSAGIGIYHSVMGYGHRPRGDGHERSLSDRPLLEQLWAEAGNAVQWRR